MGHVEPVREKPVVNILNRFLQGENMPFPCNLLLDSSSSQSGSWVEVLDAVPFLDR